MIHLPELTIYGNLNEDRLILSAQKYSPGLKVYGGVYIIQQTSSKCIQNTRANAGRLLDRINGWVAFRLIAFRLISFRVVYIYTN